ncbi:MAG TPA: hypothetical protein VFW31_10695 [Candidatus Angelobacter sp.]|nr:hypothetical protein [Candidatus Angelobacter sp.]
MPRFLTFDEKTASTLREQVPEQQVFEHGAKSAVDYALGSEKTMVTVMPTGAAREAAIAVFRRPKLAKPVTQPELRGVVMPEMRKPAASVPVPIRDSALRAGGFLGLRDEAVFEDAPVVKKKQSWWRQHFWPDDE